MNYNAKKIEMVDVFEDHNATREEWAKVQAKEEKEKLDRWDKARAASFPKNQKLHLCQPPDFACEFEFIDAEDERVEEALILDYLRRVYGLKTQLMYRFWAKPDKLRIRNLIVAEMNETAKILWLANSKRGELLIRGKKMESRTFLDRGIGYGRAGKDNQAIEAFNRAIELNPTFAEAYHNRGVAYLCLGNYDQAIKDYDKAIELQPQAAVTYNSRGFAYGVLKNHNQAIRDYDKAIELKPEYAEAYCWRGLAYGKLGNHNRLANDMRIAARLGNQEAQDYLRMLKIRW